VGPEYVHDLPELRIISPEYQRLLNNEIIIVPEYQHLLNTEIMISPEYQHLLNTDIIIVPEYVHDLPKLRSINLKYQRLLNTEIMISPEYQHLLNTEIMIRPEYQRLLNTEINIMPYYVTMRPIEILIGLVATKDMPTTIEYNIKYEISAEILWELNVDLSRFGGFHSADDADKDAKSKNYTNYTIQEIINDDGAVFYSYRVNQDNDFVCGISTPKKPKYGLIRGG
jgi:hypothetical protein